MIRKKEKEQRSIRFPIDLFDKIDKYALKEGCSFTEAVISILQEHFLNDGSNNANFKIKLTKEKMNKLTNTPCHQCSNYGLMKMRVDNEGYARVEKTCAQNRDLFPEEECIDFKQRVKNAP